jgi:SAM-dependent methyltransferase
MEKGKAVAPAQADGLRRIFEKHRVREGARILDLGCGIGRIAINLAKKGYDVVGVDISPLYVRLAERWAAKEQVSDRTTFYRMDARKAPQLLEKTRKKFDAVVNIGTSMGYYGKIEDQRIFGGLGEVTGPRGILVIETVNRDYLVNHFQDHAISNRGGVEWRENRRLDLESSFMRNSWKFYRKSRGSLRIVANIPMSHRVYSLHELIELIDSSQWNYLESYGSLRELAPLTTESIHMTIVGGRR